MASFISVTTCFGMVDKLWPFVGDVNPRSVMLQLRTHFVEQTHIWEHELMGDFLSIKMEENSSLDDHLEHMHNVYMRPAYFLDSWMMGSFAKTVMLRSLPPSYQAQVRTCVMRGDAESMEFHRFVTHLRNVLVEPDVAQVINDKAIYLIYNFINVIILQTHLKC